MTNPLERLSERLGALDSEQRRYALEAFAGHLRDAQQYRRLGLLFEHDEWMVARFEADGGVYDGYLADLSIAWHEMAVPAARREIEAGQPPFVLGDCVRYAAIRASLNSVAGNYPDELVVRAVEAGLWDPVVALSRVTEVADPAQRTVAQVAIIQTGRLPAGVRNVTVRTALASALAVPSEWDRAEALERVAPLLGGDLLESALDSAIAMQEARQLRALVALIRQLDEPRHGVELERARQTLAAMESPRDRFDGILSLLEFLDGSDRREAVRQALAIADEKDPSFFLIGDLTRLSDRLCGDSRRDVLDRAVAAVRKLRGKDLAFALRDVLPRLESTVRDALIEQTFEPVMALADADREYDLPRPAGLMAMGPYLRGARLDRALSTARTMLPGDISEFKWARAATLRALVPALDGTRRAEVLEELIDTSRSAGDLTELVPLLPLERREEVIEQALDAAGTLGDRPGNFGEPSPRRVALGRLAPVLPDQMVADALQRAAAIKDGEPFAAALLALSSHLGESARVAVQRTAFDALWSMRHDYMVALDQLLPRLVEPVVAEVLERVLTLPTDGPFTSRQGVALIGLVPGAGAVSIDRIAEAAHALPRNLDRAEVLTAVIPHLAGRERRRACHSAFESAVAIDGAEYLIANALRDLGPFLDSPLPGAALDTLLSIDDSSSSDYVSQALVTLAPRLNGPLARRGLNVISARREPYQRVAGLVALIPQLTGKDQARAHKRAVRTAVRMRDDLDSEKAAIAAASLLDGKQREHVVRLALARTERILDPEMRSSAMAQIARLGGPASAAALQESFEWALKVEREPQRSKSLHPLLDQMDSAATLAALDKARGVEPVHTRAQALSAFVSRLPSADASAVIQETRGAILDHLAEMEDQQSPVLLQFLDHPTLFAPPILPVEQLELLTARLLALRSRWRWQ